MTRELHALVNRQDILTDNLYPTTRELHALVNRQDILTDNSFSAHPSSIYVYLRYGNLIPLLFHSLHSLFLFHSTIYSVIHETSIHYTYLFIHSIIFSFNKNVLSVHESFTRIDILVLGISRIM